MAKRPLHRVQAALAARRHFIGRQSKSQIAEELGVSRFKVARLIDSAIDDGIIQFVIAEPKDLNTELGEAVRHRYRLQAALVLDGSDAAASVDSIEPIGALAAQLLEETLADGQVLGVAWGRTLAAMAAALTQLPRVDVVQVAGSPIGLDYTQSPVELVHRLASLSGGTAYPVFGPMWAEDPLLVERFRREPAIANTLRQCERLDVLVVGIGSWSPSESCLCSGFPPAWREQALADGVRADLCTALLDSHGSEVPSVLDASRIGISIAQMRKVPNIVGIGGGREKAGAIAAVLKGGWINTLITDTAVARRLLA